ncbi:transposase for insertion sequence element [Corynebacterium variabile DSM 44702]|uniref:Transposase for insertion sequence element n=1 Tax=Corynebacterium variabile (strain DSM 44702 / CIP 107183 / JCM 12073 / NCIMB 30131) TaxID=858619 RepID=G0HGD9_CORVD|nr:hypothetical protein [Corynebacterium variabile]AEK38178.1 transposase for insertion sequence element [Corynebacterium variabile DSM 44702]
MKTTNTIIDVTTDRSVCSNSGTLLIADTANALGVTDVLDEHRAGLTPDTVTHTAGTVMTSLAVALTVGATCLDDLDLLRPLVNTGLTSPIGSVTTAHRRLHQLAESADKVETPHWPQQCAPSAPAPGKDSVTSTPQPVLPGTIR